MITREEANVLAADITDFFEGSEYHDAFAGVAFESGALVARVICKEEEADEVRAAFRSFGFPGDWDEVVVEGEADIEARFPFETNQPESLFDQDDDQDDGEV